MWFERNVMYSVCIYIRFECSGGVTDGIPKKKIGGFLEFF